MCGAGFPPGRLVGKCIIYIMLVLVGGNFFIGGVLVDRIGSEGRMLALIERLLIGVAFLL